MYNDAETIEIVNGAKIKKIYNLKEFLEKNSEKIKTKIILFVYKLKNKKINLKNFQRLFNIDGNFSAWDLSLINEKNVYKSDCFYNLTKFIALNEIIEREKKNNIILKNFEKNFIKTFTRSSIYSLNKDRIKIIFSKCKNENFKEIILNLINYSSILSFVYFLFYIIKNFQFEDNRTIDHKYNCIFFNYFTQYNKKEFEKKNFRPNQWPTFLSYKKNIYWFNIFLPDENFKSLKSVNKFIKIKKIRNINFVNNYFNFEIFLRIVKIYLSFNYKYFKFSKIFRSINYDNDYNLFFEKELKRSLTCFHLLQNLSYHFLLKNILKKNNFLKNKFFYLYENQPWERSLNFLLRKKNIKHTYGYSHTTINYWHLNYFHSFKENKNFKKNYLPEKILCHSQNCRNYLINQGVLKKQILNVSAERFKWTKNIKSKKISKKIKILVIGDYEKEINKNLIKIIGNLNKNFHIRNKFYLSYKPHPSSNFSEANLDKNIKITKKDLSKIIHKYDIIISTNSTSASAELSSTKKKILIFLDESNLDLSPFKKANNYKNAFNFTNENDLIKKINNIKNIKKLDYNFYFDKKNYIIWKKLTK